MSETSIYGLNAGNSLSYTSLRNLPPTNVQLPVNYNELTMGPRYSSFQPQFTSPASRNFQLASMTSEAWGQGAYNQSNGPFLSAFNDVADPMLARQCKNASDAALTGRRQCWSPATQLCQPLPTSGCPAGTQYLYLQQ